MGTLLVLGAGFVATACSFPWDDYTPAVTATASGGGGGTTTTTGNGGGGACMADQKPCGAMCVAKDDPNFGCDVVACDPCMFPNGVAACTGGSCTMTGCAQGYDDCDMDGASCETSTLTSAEHCGGCNQPCAGTCVNGTCSPESCTNGVDDDDDGMIDCADPDCATFSCVEVPAGGWQGPVFLYDGTLAMKPADCSATTGTVAYEGFNGLSAAAPMCSACTCGNPAVACNLAQLEAFSDAGCTTSVANYAQPAPPSCTSGAITGAGIVAFSATAPSANGTCPPGGGQPTNAPPTWSDAGLACQPDMTGAGCATGVCVGGAPMPFGAKPCVYRPGDQACPAGFGDKHLFSDGANDTRDCSNCTCGASPGAACSATTHLYGQAACAGAATNVPNDGSCTPSAVLASTDVTVTTTLGGACPPAGGAPTGSVMPSGSTTVCCVP